MTQNDQDQVIRDIQMFIKKIGSDFNDILRMNQGSRYQNIYFIKSSPLKKSIKYKDSSVIGIFYKDTQQEDGILFKQDFVISPNDDSNYTFVIGDHWSNKFPKLKKFREFIWNFQTFNGEIANGNKYQDENGFNHHYKSIDDLPLEVADSLRDVDSNHD